MWQHTVVVTVVVAQRTFQCEGNSPDLSFTFSDPVDEAEDAPDLPGNVSSLARSFSSSLSLIFPTGEEFCEGKL